MFVGQSKHTITKDGRLSLPSKMRDVIGKKYDTDEVYIVLLPENILCIYPESEFEKMVEELTKQLGSSLGSSTQLKREICSNADQSKIDSSGRIVIPQEMRDAAEIDQDVLVLGTEDHMELWNPERWKYYKKDHFADVMKAFQQS